MAKRVRDAFKSITPSLVLATSLAHTRRWMQSPTLGRRSSPSGRSDANPAPRRTCPPRTRASHPLRKSSQLTRPSMTRLSNGLSSWTQILMLGGTKKIAKGIAGWAMRDTMICNLPKHGKAQPNHLDPVGLPLDYMGKHQVFNGIRSDTYDLCWFYILGMTGDPPEFPTPWEPTTCGQIRDLLKSPHAIG